MKHRIIKYSDILNHPTKRMDAKYWIKEGKNKMTWTNTIDILGQIAHGNMFNQNITPEQARKELKRMAQLYDLLINKQDHQKSYLPKYDLIKLTTNLEPRGRN